MGRVYHQGSRLELHERESVGKGEVGGHLDAQLITYNLTYNLLLSC